MSTQPQPAPVLAWHRETANEVRETIDRLGRCYVTDEGLSAIIAAHDPHAETARLLEKAITLLDDCGRNRTSGIMYPDVKSWVERTHLAKLKGTR